MKTCFAHQSATTEASLPESVTERGAPPHSPFSPSLFWKDCQIMQPQWDTETAEFVMRQTLFTSLSCRILRKSSRVIGAQRMAHRFLVEQLSALVRLVAEMKKKKEKKLRWITICM